MQTRPFSIIYSNYTGYVFAWPGTKAENKKYLGNREVIAVVQATNSEEAIQLRRQNNGKMD